MITVLHNKGLRGLRWTLVHVGPNVGENAHPLSLDSLDSLDSLASLAQCGPLPALVPDGKCCQTQNFTNLNHY